jgi:hypothetical protein
MAKQKEAPPTESAGSSEAGGQLARLVAVLGINLFLVILVIILSSTHDAPLPDLTADTLAIGLLPVSAALGLVVACRRIDLSLPALFVLAIALRSHPPDVFEGDPPWRLAGLCILCGGLCLVSAVVTWLGRIASVLWTGLLAMGLWEAAQYWGVQSAGTGGWPWPAALGASLGVLVIGAALLGAIGLVSLPSLPPIIRSGPKGILGLASAWVVAGFAIALASQSVLASPSHSASFQAYAVTLSATALGGAYIMRGRWGAVAAVAMTVVGHLAWSYAMHMHTGSVELDLAVAAAAPLAAIPLYLSVDWLIRRSTGESSPTGLLA